MGTTSPISAIHSLDEKATRMARGAASARLAFGEALDVFTQRALHHELGFSNVAAYVTEHCDLSPAFASTSASVARRLQSTPLIRELLARGQLAWSRAELASKLVAASQSTSSMPATELEWLAKSAGKTCLALREELAKLKGAAARGVNPHAPSEPQRTVTFTLPERDLWLFEAAELVCHRVSGECSREQFFEWLVAEASTALESREPIDPTDEERQQRFDRWRAQLAQWRLESERRSEAQREPLRAPRVAADGNFVPLDELRAWPAKRLHLHLVSIANEITRHDLELGALAQKLHRHEVWLRLGFASEAHYARERLGLSMSSLKQKRQLIRRLEHQPTVEHAVLQGLIGYGAALLITRVTNAKNVTCWIERARQRTLKHLAEEVAFVERVLERRPEHPAFPPPQATLRASLSVEGHIKSGRYFSEPESRPIQSEALVREYEQATTETDGQISNPKNSDNELDRGPVGVPLGHVRLRVRVSEPTLALLREIERGCRQVAGRPALLAALSEHFLGVWCPTLVSNRAYEHIYMRDRFRCSSPVCRRHDVTPHHLVYRSRGGGDEPDNLASLCTWCHLEGIHGGRIHARRVNGEVHWEIGRGDPTIVQGRDRVAPTRALP